MDSLKEKSFVVVIFFLMTKEQKLCQAWSPVSDAITTTPIKTGWTAWRIQHVVILLPDEPAQCCPT